MKKLLTKLVRWSTRWAWEKEIGAVEGIAILQELNMKEGGMESKIKLTPGMGEWIGTCFASMVADSPNYTEMQFETHGEWNKKHHWMTITIQKHEGKTPHQLRMAAEADKASWKKAAETNRDDIDNAWAVLNQNGIESWDGTTHTTLAGGIQRLVKSHEQPSAS